MSKNINIESLHIYVSVPVGKLTPDSIRKGINTFDDDYDGPAYNRRDFFTIGSSKTPQYHNVLLNTIYLDTMTSRYTPMTSQN